MQNSDSEFPTADDMPFAPLEDLGEADSNSFGAAPFSAAESLDFNQQQNFAMEDLKVAMPAPNTVAYGNFGGGTENAFQNQTPNQQPLGSYAANGSALQLLARLKMVLQDENAILKSQELKDHNKFIIQKNQILREMMALQKNPSEHLKDMEIIAALEEVREMITENSQLLSAQLQAMQQITQMLTEVELKEDQDGTYSREEIVRF